VSKTDMLFALIVLGLLLAGFARATVFASHQVRRMRWRTRLRLRPGAGFASHWEITFRFSRLAALVHGRRCRPDMPITGRLISPARLYAVRLGRAQFGRKAYARGEDQVGIIAPQRTNKTGILADRIYGHPAAAVAVTTRADLYRLTSGKRAQLGPVQVFNPEGIGGIDSDFRVDIVADCADPEVAIRTASALTGPTEGSGDMQFWLEKAVFAMAALLHAAALLGQEMSAVWRWSQRLGDPIRDALACPGVSPELLAAAAEIQREGKSADSIRMTMARSLAWVGVPALRRAVSGHGIGPFNAMQWVRHYGTLYVINSGELSSPGP
jgi:type IV secretion system protein VirD4